MRLFVVYHHQGFVGKGVSATARYNLDETTTERPSWRERQQATVDRADAAISRAQEVTQKAGTSESGQHKDRDRERDRRRRGHVPSQAASSSSAGVSARRLPKWVKKYAPDDDTAGR